MYGCGQRTPLDALYHNLVEHEGSNLRVAEWVECMADRLSSIREVDALGAAKCLNARQRQYNKDIKLRQFNKGDKVWYCTPSLHNKLGESWEGP